MTKEVESLKNLESSFKNALKNAIEFNFITMKDHLLYFKLMPGTKGTQNINKCGRKFLIKNRILRKKFKMTTKTVRVLIRNLWKNWTLILCSNVFTFFLTFIAVWFLRKISYSFTQYMPLLFQKILQTKPIILNIVGFFLKANNFSFRFFF